MSTPMLSNLTSAALAGCSVLVVENNYHMGEELATVLRSHGAHVLGPAADVVHGRALLASAKPACAVLDVSSKPGSMFALAEELQDRGIPSIFAASQDSTLIPQILPKHLRDIPYLQRPVHGQDLVELVRLARDRASAQRATASLIRRFESAASLSVRDKRMLEAATVNVQHLEAHQDLSRQCSSSKHVLLLVEGVACRYRQLPDGRRQITAFVLPGDLCQLNTLGAAQRLSSIVSLSHVEVGMLPVETVDEWQTRPALASALTWDTALQQSIAWEWLVNVGRRTAFERLAHLLCEIYERLQTVGLAQDGCCHLPITQGELADALALTPVHINRTLMELRRHALVTFQSRRLLIHDYPRLCKAAGFERSYLS